MPKKKRRRNRPKLDLFECVVRPNYEPHHVYLLDKGEVESTFQDLEAGRDMSIFGALSDPYVYEFPAVGRSIAGDADLIDDFAVAADTVRKSGLDEDDKRTVWIEILSEDLPNEYYRYYGDLAEDILDEHE